MWYYVTGTTLLSGDMHWQYSKGGAWSDDEEGVKLSFHLPSLPKQYQRGQAIKATEQILEQNNISWITTGHKEWTLDLDKILNKIKKSIPEISGMDWFKGKVSIEPEFEPEERTVFGKPQHQARVTFYIVPEVLRRSVMLLEPPIEIKESLEPFKSEYPDSAKVAFIMMQFGKTKAHDGIVEAIRKVLGSYDISGVKANDKQYHDDLFHNVETYLYGCGFGIAVFERIESEEFNPNVSLEVGYMLALKKPVCLLTDKTIEKLNTDLIGKLCKFFDPQDPIETIPGEITQWLSDKRII